MTIDLFQDQDNLFTSGPLFIIQNVTICRRTLYPEFTPGSFFIPIVRIRIGTSNSYFTINERHANHLECLSIQNNKVERMNTAGAVFFYW